MVLQIQWLVQDCERKSAGPQLLGVDQNCTRRGHQKGHLYSTMTQEERIEAASRSPKYKQAVREFYEHLRDKHKGKDRARPPLAFIKKLAPLETAECEKFAQRWGLPIFFDPDDPDHRPAIESWKQGARKMPRKTAVPVRASLEGENLVLRILRSEKLSVKLRWAAKLIRIDDRQLGKSKSRDKKYEAEMWRVYDARRLENKTFMAIMKEMFNIDKHPTYDEEAKQYYERIRRASQHACELIREFENSSTDR